jgi:BED zinc finger
MSETINLTEPETQVIQVTQLGKRKTLRSDLFTKGFFEEKDLPPEHKDAKNMREVKCLNCNKTWFRKIGDSNTSNMWRHLEKHHPDKDPKSKKSKNLEAEGQSTLDTFVGQTKIASKVSVIS